MRRAVSIGSGHQVYTWKELFRAAEWGERQQWPSRTGDRSFPFPARFPEELNFDFSVLLPLLHPHLFSREVMHKTEGRRLGRYPSPRLTPRSQNWCHVVWIFMPQVPD